MDKVSTEEHFTKRANIKEHSNNGSTPQPRDSSKVSKGNTVSTKEHSTLNGPLLKNIATTDPLLN